MMTRLKKASEISEANIQPIFIDDENIQFNMKSSNDSYLVSCNFDKLWACTCDDFAHRGVNREEGSFLCKHCLSAINYLMNTPKEQIIAKLEENNSSIEKAITGAD